MCLSMAGCIRTLESQSSVWCLLGCLRREAETQLRACWVLWVLTPDLVHITESSWTEGAYSSMMKKSEAIDERKYLRIQRI